MFAAAVSQALVELPCVFERARVGHPEPFRTLTLKLRFLQGWSVFAPDPPMGDGTLVVDAIAVGGRHVDPLTGVAPDFDLAHARSLGNSHVWAQYRDRLRSPGYAAYRDAMKEYLMRLPDRTGDPSDALVGGDVYVVTNHSPPFGETAPYGTERTKLFSFGRSAARGSPGDLSPSGAGERDLPAPP
jgi:hypothetical protein